MKKTIVVTPERTETYVEMVPVTKTRVIPAVTKTEEVGPGYAEVYHWSGEPWQFNRQTLHEKPDPKLANDVPRADHTGAVFAALYVPPGITKEAALAALNALTQTVA